MLHPHAQHSAGRTRSQGALRTKPGKLMGNPSHPALWKGCQDIDSTFHLHLNTTSLSPNSFFLSLTSRTAHNPLRLFRALLDSGSSHSLVIEPLVLKNKLKFSYLPKVILLRMFDSSTMSTVNRM